MPSLVTARLELQPHSGLTATRAHGIVTQWLESDLSEQQHRSGKKGFSLFYEGSSSFPSLWIGIVDDSLLSILGDSMAHGLPPHGKVKGRLIQAEDGSVAEVNRIESWEDLLLGASPTRSFTFRAISPMVFRSGRLSNPLPIPTLVFGHLRDRWQAFAPNHLCPEIEFDKLGLVISRFKGGTELVAARGQTYPGFLGEFTIHAGNADEREQRVLNALARLAPYSGIGANTTIGMGRCDYLDT
jgi:CRISPR-associated endoribonuclease Cas6